MIDFDILYNSKQFIQIKPEYHNDISTYFQKKIGSVYVATSKNNSLLKIGRTSKNPLERANTLSTVGVLYDFEIMFSLPFLNQFWAESEVHKKLKKFRVDKEFFGVKQPYAIEVINEVYHLEEHLLKRYFNVSNLKNHPSDISDAIKGII